MGGRGEMQGRGSVHAQGSEEEVGESEGGLCQDGFDVFGAISMAVPRAAALNHALPWIELHMCLESYNTGRLSTN